MASSNPAFSRNAAFGAPGAVAAGKVLSDSDLQGMFNAPSAGSQDTDRMSYEDTIVKTVLSFALLLTAAVGAWLLTPSLPFLPFLGMIVGLVLGLVNTFKKEPSPALILSYAVAEGLFVGGISQIFDQRFSGVVVQAVLATLVVVGVTLALFANGKVRASKKATKVFLVAMVGYLVFSLVNFGLVAFGAIDSPFGLSSSVTIFGIKLGLIIGVLAVLMAAYSLVLDFDFIQRGVNNRAPRKFGWSGAFGIMVTVVWLYVELLRIFALARD
ncbi:MULTISPECIES: Bax inhibitor-1/YccA family protein [Cryobacterium]|uniref:Bax inhibitor-1/YccA family protein n=1 Tax=Cryobacterium mannosilyticum TaxID=1259190 RepID=A0A4R8WFD9_9MICO|nr:MULTISPECIES: Bax inhibitor-1/YccA family protein [Cryobacterium]TFB96892.1 Bax inhibitor-1/YccA family protein [Cryobacterium sp. HLT2-28]TFC08210.1 Bax inhibitor-1/YccA family protein [Cryobacterium mannosilyticum]